MKKRTSFLLFITTFFITTSMFASYVIQEKNTDMRFLEHKSVSLITGFQTGTYSFAEIGIGYKRDVINAPHANTLILGITNELKLNRDFVWGLKIGAWSGGGVGGTNVGINLINYTNFEKNAIRFRPEFGLGFGYFRMIYGYNFAITNKDFKGINSHLFGIHILFDIKSQKGVTFF